MERNLDQIGASTRNAINNLNPSGLKNYLDLYSNLLQYATRFNQEVIEDYGTTPPPISDLVDHIFREFYQIMEAAGRTGSSDLINTVRAEIFRLSLAYHRQGVNYLFDKSIGLYSSYYRILFSSSATNDELVDGLLSSMNNILTMLTAGLGRAKTVQEVEQVNSDLESFYGTLEDILRISIEEGDAQTFHKVWNLGDDEFVMVRPKSRIYELRRQIDQAEEGEVERLESELETKERQQEVVQHLRTEFKETRFVAAAWAYREVRKGGLQEEVFKEMFSTSIKEYSFERLAEVYLQMLTNSRLDFFKWESEDADVFKGVQTSLPSTQTWLKDFFCAMGLLLLDPAEYDLDDLDERDNPLADVEIDRRSYPDLKETIQSVSEDDLEKFGVSQRTLDQVDKKKEAFLKFHEQMEDLLERREEDSIIESNLDPERISEFADGYISGFKEEFTLRQVLEDLGWLEIQQYDGEVEGFGYNTYYPKTAFMSDPPVELVQDIDRRAQNHISSILERWLSQAEDYLSKIEVESHDLLLEEVVETCSQFGRNESAPQALVVSGFRATNSITQSEYFVDDFTAYEAAIGGFHYSDSDPIPVYRTSTRKFDVLILTGEGQPVEVHEFQRDDQPVYLNIEEVTRDLLQEHNPDGFDEMDEEEIREKLQSVWLQILYYSKFDAVDRFGAQLTIQR